MAPFHAWLSDTRRPDIPVRPRSRSSVRQHICNPHTYICPLAILLLLLGVSHCGAQTSDVKKDSRPFTVDTDDDGIRTFTLAGKKPAGDADLLPAVPKALPKAMSSAELGQVPEVGLEDALPKTWTKREAIEHLEFRFAKVNHFNLKKTDGFLHALLAQRPDLAGLPFKMGTDCRLPQEKALALGAAIGRVRSASENLPHFPHRGEEKVARSEEMLHQPLVNALMQIHGPNEKQDELARTLSTVPHVEATTALARLALFSPDAKAREVAARSLRIRREQDYTALLLEGLRYPWPAVARRAAEAFVRLERKDLLPQLVLALEAPDPRLPVQQETGWTARELVRLNHHRNCLLCHPPAHTKVLLHIPPDNKEKIEKILHDRIDKVAKELEKLRTDAEHLIAPVPLPNRSFDHKSGYGRDRELDHILVRVDITYLRQDFSALLPVEDAAPWPDFQRFDFLVRSRTLTEAEATELRTRTKLQNKGEVSPYHQAALLALRELTGLEATTPAQWRRLLKLPLPPAGTD